MTTAKRDKALYWLATGLFSAMTLMAVGMYIFNYGMVSEMFTSLGYPTYLIYPLATAKFLGVVAIVSRKSQCLMELAYAGFFYVFLLASSAHINAGDGGFVAPLVALALLLASYFLGKKVFPKK